MRSPSKSLITALALSLATLLVATNARAAANVLVNPGFETGTPAGWTGYGSRAVESTNNTYYNGGLPGGSNVLTHSGAWVGKTWGQFNGSFNINGFYQDVVAAPGSVWSADGWGLTHQQDLIQPAIRFWLEVSFRDAADTVLAMVRSHVFDSDLETISSNSWMSLAVTNEIDILDPTYSTITNFTSTFKAPVGTTKVRYQVAFAQMYGWPGGSLYVDDLNLTKIAGSDPDITTGPAAQRKVVGQTATFTVSAAGATTLSYQWRKYGTNITNGPRVSGATSATLTITGLTLADAGPYSVVVSDQAGSVVSAPAELTVVTLDQASNLLLNRGFESGADFPWTRFNGGGLATTNNLYYLTSIPVVVYDGQYVSQTYGNGPGSWNGLFQDVAAAPGQSFTADGMFYLAEEDPLTGESQAWLEVQFMNSADQMIGLYKSDYIKTNGFPTNTWVNLRATNIIAFWSDYSVVGQTNVLVAPPGTAKVRTQITFQAINGGGSIWYDNLNLFVRYPFTLTAQKVGSEIHIGVPTQLGVNYQLLYKTEFSDNWSLLTSFAGDGTTKIIPDPIGATKRFYRVNSL